MSSFPDDLLGLFPVCLSGVRGPLYSGRCSPLCSGRSGRTGDLYHTSIKGLNYSPVIHCYIPGCALIFECNSFAFKNFGSVRDIKSIL